MLFGRHHKKESKPCEHAKALPRWDNVEDTGRPDRISRLYCPSCDSFVTPKAPVAVEAGDY